MYWSLEYSYSNRAPSLTPSGRRRTCGLRVLVHVPCGPRGRVRGMARGRPTATRPPLAMVGDRGRAVGAVTRGARGGGGGRALGCSADCLPTPFVDAQDSRCGIGGVMELCISVGLRGLLRQCGQCRSWPLSLESVPCCNGKCRARGGAAGRWAGAMAHHSGWAEGGEEEEAAGQQLQRIFGAWWCGRFGRVAVRDE
jgi:hypothetical protein